MTTADTTQALRAVTPLSGESVPADRPGEKGFADKLAGALDEVSGRLAAADGAASAVARGEPASIHEVMIAAEKAEISFKLMTQVGRKVIEAYRDMLRMGI